MSANFIPKTTAAASRGSLATARLSCLPRTATAPLLDPNFGYVPLGLECRFWDSTYDHKSPDGQRDRQTYRQIDRQLTMAILRFPLRALRGNNVF